MGDYPPLKDVCRLLDEARADLARERERAAALEAGLRSVFALIDDGVLVRNTTRDAEPDWYLRAMRLTNVLADAQRLIDRPKGDE